MSDQDHLPPESSSSGNLTRRDFLRLCGGAAAGIAAAPLLGSRLFAETGKKPNIIFILADDLGWGDLGCYGHNELRTPNLDRLAKQGVRFTNFYVNGSVCSPSRAAFTTGRFPAQVHIHDYLRYPLTPEQKAGGVAEYLDPKTPTLARILHDAGYATAHFGKWHLGTGPASPQPGEYGYEETRTLASHGGPTFQGVNSDPYFRAKSSGLIVDEAIKFIEQNKDKPFYVNVWSIVPHAVLNPTDEQAEAYKGKHPLAPDRGTKIVYYSSVSDLDAQIGRLMNKLDELGLSDNTIVLFSSDNGPEDISLTEAAHSGIGSPGPFRGRKRSLYDGGIRTPFIVRWPGVAKAGTVNDTSVVAAVDFLPTLTKAAGAQLPKDIELDGEDMGDVLGGSQRQRKTTLYWEYRFPILGHQMHRSPRLAIREDNWKLLCNPDGSRIELYDLSNHGTEFDNLADEHPDIAKRLSEKLIAWANSLPPGKAVPAVGKNDYAWPK